MVAAKKKSKAQESINSRLALVIKSGKYSLGYKSTLKTLRNGKGECCPPVRKSLYPRRRPSRVAGRRVRATVRSWRKGQGCRRNVVATEQPGCESASQNNGLQRHNENDAALLKESAIASWVTLTHPLPPSFRSQARDHLDQRACPAQV